MAATLAQCATYGQNWGHSAARIFSIKGNIDCASVSLQLILDHFVCPLTLEVMTDPQLTVDGQVYEKEDIQRWFKLKRREGKPITSPCTGLELTSPMIVSMVALQKAIETFLANRPEYQEAQAAKAVVQRMKSGQALDDVDGFSCPKCGGLRASNKRLRAEVKALQGKLAQAEEHSRHRCRPTLAEILLFGMVMYLLSWHVSDPDTMTGTVCGHFQRLGHVGLAWILTTTWQFLAFAAFWACNLWLHCRFGDRLGEFPVITLPGLSKASRMSNAKLLLGFLFGAQLYFSETAFSIRSKMAGLQEPPAELLWTEEVAMLLPDDDIKMHEDGLMEMQGSVEAQQTTAQPIAGDESESETTSGYGLRHEQKKSQWLPGRPQRTSPKKEAVRNAVSLFRDAMHEADKVETLVAGLTLKSQDADAKEAEKHASAEATRAFERAVATRVQPHDGFISGIGLHLRRYIASNALKAWTGGDYAPIQTSDNLKIQKAKMKAKRIRAAMNSLRDAVSATERLKAAAIQLTPQHVHPDYDEQAEGKMTMPEEDPEEEDPEEDPAEEEDGMWISSGMGVMRTSSSNWRGQLPAHGESRIRTWAHLSKLFRDAAKSSEAVAAFVN